MRGYWICRAPLEWRSNARLHLKKKKKVYIKKKVERKRKTIIIVFFMFSPLVQHACKQGCISKSGIYRQYERDHITPLKKCKYIRMYRYIYIFFVRVCGEKKKIYDAMPHFKLDEDTS